MTLSRQKKLQLIRGISNENFFRKEVLIPLFRNMDKFVQVLDNHGANEKGTDIILVEKAVFGGYQYTSVVVKCLPINNATSPKKDRETAANISQQTALAINSGHYCNLTNQQVDFHTVMIVTNQTISNTARESLINGAKMFRFIDIRFQQGEDLLDLIDAHLQEFYFYQSGVHARVATALQRKCESLNDLQNLPQFTVEERALIDVFVQPRLQRIESRYIEGKRRNQVVVKTSDQVILQNNRVLIIGEAGAGKSIILRETVLNLLSENTRDTKTKLPILVKAYDLAKSSSIKFIDTLNNVVNRYYSLDDFDFESIRKDVEITLLIDGLDEIVDLSQRESVKEKIATFGNENPNIKIIITSRRTQDITGLNSMSSYQHWEILTFNFVQVREFLKKWFSNREDSNHRFLVALEDHKLLSRLPSTPLVLTLLAILFDSDDYREIPANLAELYQMFLDLLLGKWNLDRRVETMYNANIREYLATEVAVHMHKDKIISISSHRFIEIIVNAARQRGIDVNPSVLLNDFTEQTALMVFNDKKELEFRHLSFQEFLVAIEIFKHTTEEKVEFLIQHFEESWWTKVLYFYCGLRQDTPEILNSIINRLPELEIPERMNSIFELGYLIQAAYLTPIQVRMNSVEVSIRQFHNCINSIKELSINNQKLPEGMVYSTFVFLLSMHFTSRMMQKFYLGAFDKLKINEVSDAETSFLMLALATFLAHNNYYQSFAEVDKFLKYDNRQLFTLKLMGDFLEENLSREEKRSAHYKEFRKTVNKIRRWFKDRPEIIKNLMTSASEKSLENSST